MGLIFPSVLKTLNILQDKMLNASPVSYHLLYFQDSVAHGNNN